MNMILTYLHDNWERLQLQKYSPTRQLSTVMITPRFRASSHVVCLLLPQGQAKPVMVAKVPRLAGPSASVRREVANLRAVQASRPEGFSSIPHVIAFEEHASRQFLLETALSGKPMDPPAVRSDAHHCSQAMLDWLGDLQVATKQTAQEDDDWYEKLVAGPLRRFRNLLPLADEERQWLAKTEELVAPLQEADLPLVFEHGDLSHPNVMWLHDGQPGVVDWELATPRGLPGFDLFFFLSYVAFARHKARSSRAHLAAFRAAFFGEAAWAIPYIRSYGERLQLPEGALVALFVLTWLRYAASLLGRLDEAGQSSGVLSAETAVWLRENRYYEMWRYAVTHVDELRW
jgi:aminoglycoside phosphotransferase